MALGTPTSLTTGNSAVTEQSIATASISPTANALVIMCFGVRTAVDLVGVSITDSFAGGLGAWTTIPLTFNNSGTRCSCIFGYALAGATPGSGTITTSWGADSANKGWIVSEITGTDMTTPVNQYNTNTGANSTLTVNLANMPKSDSVVLGLLGSRDPSITPGASYIELAEDGTASYHAQVEYDTTPTSVTVNWSGLTSLLGNAGFGVEVQAPITWTPNVIMS
ncbi:MAG: hypothetical protein M3P98_02690 [bacterium]|nr:hypothetical protein [bacterium]